MSPEDSATTRLIRITGVVQGVWFRGWTVKTARSLGLSGWVRNRRDGSVEALLRGSSAAVEEMVKACREGPPAARVDHITIDDIQPSGEDLASEFIQRPTI